MTLEEILVKKDYRVAHKFCLCLLMQLSTEKKITQKEIGERIGYKGPEISAIKNAGENANKHLFPFLSKLISAYSIEIEAYDEHTGEIKNLRYQIVPENSEVVNELPRVFTDKRNWLIYCDLGDEIGIRVLKIYDDGKVEYILKSDDHEDYEGKLNCENKEVLVLDLNVKISKKKDLRIYLWINDITSNPSIMAGVLTYYRLNDGGIDSYRILAIPVGEENANVETKRKSELQGDEILVSEYFHLTGPNRLYSTKNIKNKKSLISYLDGKKTDKRHLIKLELITKIRSCNDLNILKRYAKVIDAV